MIWLWMAFVVFILILLAIDLGVFHRREHVVSVKESLVWCGVWVAVTLAFSVVIYFLYEHSLFGVDLGPNPPRGREAVALFLTGYVVEESLSMDNMFVISVILSYFAVPAVQRHRVLFWGILGALVMRGVMITGGAMLVQQFNWILYVFGAFLILTGVRMLKSTKKVDPAKNPVLRITRRFLPMTQHFDGGRFITRLNGRRALTPLALALVTVESADVVFAVDSIPTIFAITDIPFIIFTSNVFAILGLRSLFFALAGMMDRFHYLSVSLAVLLVLIGVKMLLKDALHAIPGLTYWTLGLVVAVLAAGIAASLLRDAARRRAKR